jgi:hypothetical protein
VHSLELLIFLVEFFWLQLHCIPLYSQKTKLLFLIMPKLTTAKRKKKSSERNTACCGAVEAAEAVTALAQRALQYGLCVESTLDRGRVRLAANITNNTENMHIANSNPQLIRLACLLLYA